MKKNEQLEQIRKRVSQSVKNEVDEMIAWIDCAYELGCRDTKQKLNSSDVGQHSGAAPTREPCIERN